MKAIIIGSGMAGFGAAYRLNQYNIKPVMYEAKPYHGGHTASFKYEDGFIFDDGPHISFTKDTRIQELFARSVGGQYEILQARVNNYWQGHWIKHPAQVNLYGLPKDLVKKIILEFIENKYDEKSSSEIVNYKDWLYAQFGKTFAETFPMQYGKKYHTTTADNMSIDWLGSRIYTPEISEVLEGALSYATPDVHYVDNFRYPTKNGFVSYLDMFLPLADLHCSTKVTGINPQRKEVRLSDKSVVNYDALISSMPLTELIPRIDNVPEEVKSAVKKLAWTKCMLVNIGIDRNDISDSHWSYFYDDDYIFTRVSYPHMFSSRNVPDGAGSIQAELYYSDKYRLLDMEPRACIEPVINDLRKCGLIKDSDTILHTSVKFVPYANIIFDLDRMNAVSLIHSYLDEQKIHYCGRYGEWGYHWTDESFISGENAAENSI